MDTNEQLCIVTAWTGRDAQLLRQAKRLSTRWFATHIGVTARVISMWEAGGREYKPSIASQELLDATLSKTVPVAQARFIKMVLEDHGGRQPGFLALLPGSERYINYSPSLYTLHLGVKSEDPASAYKIARQIAGLGSDVGEIDWVNMTLTNRVEPNERDRLFCGRRLGEGSYCLDPAGHEGSCT